MILACKRQQASVPLRAPLPVYAGRGGPVVGIDPNSNKSLLQAAGDDAPRGNNLVRFDTDLRQLLTRTDFTLLRA